MNQAGRIEAAARRMGYTVRWQEASTGTVYLHCERDTDYITVRVGDHAEAYPPQRGERQVSVSPGEWTAAQAIDALRNPETVERYIPEPTTAEEYETRAFYKAEREHNMLRATLKAHRVATELLYQFGNVKEAQRAVSKGLAAIPDGCGPLAVKNAIRILRGLRVQLH